MTGAKPPPIRVPVDVKVSIDRDQVPDEIAQEAHPDRMYTKPGETHVTVAVDFWSPEEPHNIKTVVVEVDGASGQQVHSTRPAQAEEVQYGEIMLDQTILRAKRREAREEAERAGA